MPTRPARTRDYPLPQAWRYRNWVIAAFNADLPYDEFVREQIAGDLLPAGRSRARRPTASSRPGYLAIARRFGHDIDKDVHLTCEDTIDTLGQAFLGLTIACARCHDHKFDPITADDYYALYGILAGTRCRSPAASPPPRRATSCRWRPAGWPSRSPRGRRATSRCTSRRPEKPGAVVPRRFLEVLGGQTLPPGGGSGRLELAGWLTAARRTRSTARVMVNRIWQHHFGRGIVPTPNDFGSRGQPPTHPELLDWLAAEFVESAGSVKAMHRLIVLVATPTS